MKITQRRIIPLRQVPSTFYSPERDGVTFTLLSTFKECREKARLVLNGWTPKRTSYGVVFGSLVHGVNQRIYQDVRDGELTELPSEKYIMRTCRAVEAIWKKENPKADTDSLQHLESCMILLEAIMPMYFKYWKKDFRFFWERVEAEFKIPITVPHPNTGKTMRTFLRGKLDGSFGKKPHARQWLFETKTKSYLGERGESDLADILPFELQVNIYMTYLWMATEKVPEGLLYNIIRRPGQTQKKKESILKYARRVAEDIRRRPDYYFIRMQMFVTRKDLERNELEIKDLVADFMLWWNGLGGHYKNSNACQNKYGTCGFLPVCSRGDYSSFYKRDKVFRELADEL